MRLPDARWADLACGTARVEQLLARPAPGPPDGRTGHDLLDAGRGGCRYQSDRERGQRAGRAVPACGRSPAGSREDRAEAYRRLLDASTRSFNYAYQFAHLKREAGRAAHKLLLGQTPQVWEVSSELISALHGVRLCGSVHVIAAAETLVEATSNLELGEKSARRSQRQAEALVTAQRAFLDVCREDLAYTARWYQVRRRRAERRFLREQTRD
ncbi:hypothetical protein GCM10009574_073710 [Streptomyces asiaticus]|uniref:Uncharacterized protein n=2 Tax=Streptomyces rhizosphaericus TaxID=114699 RepID=A0ABN1NZY7_9ACTN